KEYRPEGPSGAIADQDRQPRRLPGDKSEMRQQHHADGSHEAAKGNALGVLGKAVSGGWQAHARCYGVLFHRLQERRGAVCPPSPSEIPPEDICMKKKP